MNVKTALAMVSVSTAVAGLIGAVRATVWAAAYRARTGDGLVFAWVIGAWFVVLCLAAVAAIGVSSWRRGVRARTPR